MDFMSQCHALNVEPEMITDSQKPCSCGEGQREYEKSMNGGRKGEERKQRGNIEDREGKKYKSTCNDKI